MMKKLFFLLLLSGITCVQAQELREGYYASGKLRYKGYFLNNQPAGEVTHYYEDGGVKAVMNHKGENTDVVLYSKDGSFITSGKYLNRKKTGEWSYRKGDVLLLREEYSDNLLNGKTIRYFKPDCMVEVKNWKSGKPDGEWNLFYDNAKLRLQAFFVDGKLEGEVKSYDYNGTLASEGLYKNNMKEGVWKFYDKTGKLECERTFHKGMDENSEAEELKESKLVDTLVNGGVRIPDPADFVDDPEAYLKISEP